MSEIVKQEDQSIIKPGENVVASMAQEFRKELLSLLEGGIKELIIDLTGVTMIDSIGIGVLVAAHNSISKSGGKLAVTNVSENICSLFKTMRLDQHLEIKAA